MCHYAVTIQGRILSEACMAFITYVDKQVASYAVNFIFTSFTNPIAAKCTYNHKHTPANSDIPCKSIIDHKN